MKSITFGHSPDADDAFMFYALAKGFVKIPGYAIEHNMQDIETLNKIAEIGKIEVTAISAAQYPKISKDFRIMSCGASVGRQYGPMVVSDKPMNESDLLGTKIGVPGEMTTSWLLYRLFAPPFSEAKFYPFDEITDAIKEREVDAGILLHEGQILYKKQGLFGVLDLGKRWFEKTNLPIPLGLDVVNRSLGDELIQSISDALKESIIFARNNENEALEYALGFGRGIDTDTGRKFVRMYVNDDTEDIGEDGIEALKTLFAIASQRGILDKAPELDIVWAN